MFSSLTADIVTDVTGFRSTILSFLFSLLKFFRCFAVSVFIELFEFQFIYWHFISNSLHYFALFALEIIMTSLTFLNSLFRIKVVPLFKICRKKPLHLYRSIYHKTLFLTVKFPFENLYTPTYILDYTRQHYSFFFFSVLGVLNKLGREKRL